MALNNMQESKTLLDSSLSPTVRINSPFLRLVILELHVLQEEILPCSNYAK